jgi:cobalt-zinc-cadmium efflux system outer membrane protein
VFLLSLCLSAWAAPLDRADFVARVLAEHPEVRAATVRHEADQAAVLPGPLPPLMVELGLAPLSLAEEPGVELSARWTLPAGQMRTLARDAAAGQAQMSAAEQRMSEVELSAVASAALDDWQLANARIARLDQHNALLHAAEEAVIRRVDVGLLPADARPMATMARLEAQQEALVATRQRSEALATLRWLAGEDIDPASLAAVPGPVWTAGTPTLPTTPAVAMAESELAMAEAMAAMADRAARPMVEVMAGYSSMWEDPMHRAMVGAGVGVPLDRGLLAERARAAHLDARAAQARAEGAHRTARRAEEAAQAMRAESQEMLRLMADEMLPVAEERARLARGAWEAGRGSLQDWLLAERESATVSLQALEAQTEVRRAEAMVCMARGQLTPCVTP